jgi:hypothetical protein
MNKKNRYLGVEQLLTNPIRMAEGGDPPEEIQILPTGEWDHPFYGKFSITEKDIEEYKQNFDGNVRRDIPINAGHDNGMSGGELPAVGWFKELVNKGSDGLWATIEWTKQGKELLAQKAYKYFSPEFAQKYNDPESRRNYRNVVVGGALTNKPYFKVLQAVVQGSETELDDPNGDFPVITLSEKFIINPSDDHMLKLENIVKKAASELNDEEKSFLREHKSELSEDNQKKFSEALADEGGEGGNEDTPDVPSSQPTPEKKEAKEPAQPGMVTLSEAELKILREKADKGVDAERQVREMKFSTEVQGMIFSEANKTGKVAPKSKDKVVAFMMSLNDAQLTSFREIVKELPEAMRFEEIGDGGNQGDGSAGEQATKLATELAKSEKISFTDALERVFAENPQLHKDYQTEQYSVA